MFWEVHDLWKGERTWCCEVRMKGKKELSYSFLIAMNMDKEQQVDLVELTNHLPTFSNPYQLPLPLSLLALTLGMEPDRNTFKSRIIALLSPSCPVSPSTPSSHAIAEQPACTEQGVFGMTRTIVCWMPVSDLVLAIYRALLIVAKLCMSCEWQMDTCMLLPLPFLFFVQ